MRLQLDLKGEAGRAQDVATSFLGNVVHRFELNFKVLNVGWLLKLEQTV